LVDGTETISLFVPLSLLQEGFVGDDNILGAVAYTRITPLEASISSNRHRHMKRICSLKRSHQSQNSLLERI